MSRTQELTMQDITWKMIESAQIKIIKEAFRLRYRKDSKFISEYAGYVKNLRNAENQDEYIKYTAITLFPNSQDIENGIKDRHMTEEAVEDVLIDE
ncbi:1714_t:CDS:2 [Ambispora gerdemannii]|uniref:1714_t:CDS:1 n=1 Tax=Ambispora gerdemannii TaxID=144530 RepID=A0A9N8WHA2_9GLOM|nr:1714_t:CDS:2 [Ambispora gerdemannii]